MTTWPTWVKPLSVIAWASTTTTGAAVVVSARLMREPVTTISATVAGVAAGAVWATAGWAPNAAATDRPLIMVEAKSRRRAEAEFIASPVVLRRPAARVENACAWRVASPSKRLVATGRFFFSFF